MLIVNLIHSAVTYMWQHGPAAITGGILGVASTVALIRFIPGLRRFIRLNRLAELEERCNELEVEKAEIKEEMQAQIEGITKSADLVWHQTPSSDIPPFRCRQTGNPPIVAIVNLKGGVGKTTLSANIAATYCSQGRRALLVDLDYQGSLTLLCLSTAQQESLRLNRHVVQQIIGTSSPTEQMLFTNIEPMAVTGGSLLAATESLSEVELKAMANWIIGNSSDDIRFRLRQVLHSREVQSAFDVIILDCPPRLTTACVNAVTAADFVLIPVSADQLSADPAPRLLTWLRKFKSESRICGDLSIGGIIANRAHNAAMGLNARQRRIWDSLADTCRSAWGEPVYAFSTVVPQSAHFEHAANRKEFAALADLSPVFKDLFEELETRFSTSRQSNQHEGIRIPLSA